jgi:hypothetical protein
MASERSLNGDTTMRRIINLVIFAIIVVSFLAVAAQMHARNVADAEIATYVTNVR